MLKTISRLLGLPTPEERTAIRASGAAFRAAFPSERVWRTTLAADEPGRLVVGLYYGTTRPPRYRFYAVDKATLTVGLIEDDSAYAPKVWR